MTQPARFGGTTRRSWLLAGLAIPLFRLRAATSFSVTYDGDNLYPVATGLHFLTPKVVNRLRDSADTQAFISQLTIFNAASGTQVKAPVHARLVVSYSIWAETFQVAIPGLGSQDGLSAAQAESWCLDNLFISASGLAPKMRYRVRFEMRSVRHNDLSSVLGDLNFSLLSMIDIFSRKASGDEQVWNVETPPFRLMDLPRLIGRVTHHG